MTGTDDLVTAPGRSWALVRAWWPLLTGPMLAVIGAAVYMARLETTIQARLDLATSINAKQNAQIERLDQRQDEADRRNATNKVILDRIELSIDRLEKKSTDDLREITRRLDRIGRAVRR